jgi:ammonium transporter, Amt family
MAGCVSVTACCDNVTPHSACLVGTIGGLLYLAITKLYKKIEVDDPIEASQIHGFCGFWGVCAVGLFDKDKGLFFSGSLN